MTTIDRPAPLIRENVLHETTRVLFGIADLEDSVRQANNFFLSNSIPTRRGDSRFDVAVDLS